MRISRLRFLLPAILLLSTGVAPFSAHGQRAAPAISLPRHHPTFTEASTSAFSASFGTPAYVSEDEPQSLTFRYTSRLAQRRHLLQVEATVPAADPPALLSIQVRSEAGAVMPLAGGVTERFQAAAPGTSVLTASWSEPAALPGVYAYDVAVRAHWSDGTVRETVTRVSLPMLRAQKSAFGHGWVLHGLPRLYVAGDLALLADGDLAHVYRRDCGQLGCPFVAGDGNFAALVATGSSYERRFGDRSVDRFDAAGLLQSRTDPQGRARRFFWTGARLDSVMDPVGRSIRLSYDAAGRLSAVADPMGRTTAISMDARGNLRQVTDPLGRRVLVADYDAEHRLLSQSDASGGVWTVTYDAHGFLAGVADPQVTTTDAGSVRPTRTHRSLAAAGSTGAAAGTRVAPDLRVPADSAYVRETDARGAVAAHWLDRYGSPLRSEGPLGTAQRTERDIHGRPVRTIGLPEADTVEHRYAGALPVWTRHSRTGAVDSLVHTPDQQLWKSFRNGVLVAEALFERDASHPLGMGGRVLLISQGPEVHAVEYADHRPATVYGPGETRHVFHERTGLRNTRQTYSTRTGVWTTLERDAYGRIVQVRLSRDPAARGDSVRYEYDLLNRLVRETDALGRTVTLVHADTLRRVTDGVGAVHEFRYNALGWLLSARDPRGAVQHYGYDREGNATLHTNRRGQTTTFTYDALGRVRARTADGQTVTYEHDLTGGGSVVTSPEGIDSVRVRLDVPLRGFTRTEQITRRGAVRYVLAEESELRGIPYLQAGSAGGTAYAVEYRLGRDTARVDAICLPGDHPFQCGTRFVDGAGPRRDLHIGALTVRADGAGVRYGIPAVDGRLGVALERDAAGRVLRRQPIGSDTSRSFAYDAAGQLRLALDSTTLAEERCDYEPMFDPPVYCWTEYTRLEVGRRVFTYDAAGNRTDGDAAYETGNRLLRAGGTSLQHDADGNVTRVLGPGRDLTLTWNALGELSGVRTPAHTLSFGYDGAGRRIRRTVDGVTTHYVYSGAYLVAELDAAGRVRAEYSWYGGQDQPHAVRVGGAVYFYLIDGPGNVVGLVDAAGTLVNEYRYGPWGEVLHERETVPQPFRFTAAMYDRETGLYWMRTRPYDPALGRFLAEDPLGIEGGPNLYAYAANDPVNNTDPDGRCANGFIAYGATIAGYTVWARCPNADLARWHVFVMRNRPASQRADCRQSYNCHDPAEEARAQAELERELEEIDRQAILERARRATESYPKDEFSRNWGDEAAIAIGARLEPVRRPLEVATVGALGAPLLLIGADAAVPYGAAHLMRISRPTQLAWNRAMGRGAENAVARATGLVKNNGQFQIESLTGTAEFRVIDFINRTDNLLIEVKNVRRLSFTNQIDDFVLWARANGYRLEIRVRPDTAVSRTFQQYIDEGIVIVTRGIP